MILADALNGAMTNRALHRCSLNVWRCSHARFTLPRMQKKEEMSLSHEFFLDALGLGWASKRTSHERRDKKSRRRFDTKKGKRPAKHGVLPGSVAGSKCTGKNYTGRIWELVSVSKFCPSFYGHPRVTLLRVTLVESCQDFSHPSVTLVENCQDLTTLAATL